MADSQDSVELFRRRIKTEFPSIGKTFIYRNIEDIYQTFQMPFSTNPGTNIGSVSLYNLTAGTLSQLKQDDPVIVSACYQGADAEGEPPWKVILSGKIVSVVTHWNGPDKIAKVTIGDASDTWTVKRCNLSWGPGVKASKVVNGLVNALKLPRGKVEVRDDFAYLNGKTCGHDLTIKEHLERVARDIREHKGKEYEVHVDRGRINFHRTGDVGLDSGVLISAETGLIGHVEPMEKDTQSNMQSKQQYSVTTLLMPELYSDVGVHIKCDLWDGEKLMKVVDGGHQGAGEGAFITKLVVEEPDG